jgi:hypothetical protein
MASFDPKDFLAKVGEGKTISKYRKDQIVFSQGQVAAGSYGGLPLRRVLRGDGSQARDAGPTRQHVGASYLRVRRVWP